jgi:hypothetical protein
VPRKIEYIGRYSVPEYAMAKQKMIRAHPELTPYRIEEICRYIAKKDWPADRRETYLYAKNNLGDHAANELRIYDEAQSILDSVHHGENWLRFYQKINGIPESDWNFAPSLVKEVLARGTYIGPIPYEFRDLENQDQK